MKPALIPNRPALKLFTLLALASLLVIGLVPVQTGQALAAKAGFPALAGQGQNLAGLFPARIEISGKSLALGGKKSGRFNCSIVRQPNGGLKVKFDSVKASSVIDLDDKLALKDSDMVFHLDGSLQKPKRSHDRRVALACPGGLELIYYNHGQTYKDKKVKFGPGRLAADNLYIYLQALLLDGMHHSFQAPLMLNSLGMTAPGKFELQTVPAHPQNLPGGPLPQDMARALAQGGPYLVWTMRVGGLIGLLSRESHHLAFDAAPPYAFAGYWGGPRGGEEYIYRTEMTIKN